MRYVYPAIFRKDDNNTFLIFFPDIEMGGTVGNDIAHGMQMAEDFLCLALYQMEEDGSQIPTASEIKNCNAVDDDIVTLISVDTEDYRRFYENKQIKKSVTIPMWLNVAAKNANINFSQFMQQALKAELGIDQPRTAKL